MIGRRILLASVLAVGLLTSATLFAQEPAAAATPDQPAGEPAPGSSMDELELTSGGYVYDPAGRRDPFVNPLGEAEGPEGGVDIRPPGFEGMRIDEISLWGITVFGDDPIAIFRGTDELGYFKREGDELWDGKLVTIDFDSGCVVFQQRVEDPTSPVRFREVERCLNP